MWAGRLIVPSQLLLVARAVLMELLEERSNLRASVTLGQFRVHRQHSNANNRYFRPPYVWHCTCQFAVLVRNVSKIDRCILCTCIYLYFWALLCVILFYTHVLCLQHVCIFRIWWHVYMYLCICKPIRTYSLSMYPCIQIFLYSGISVCRYFESMYLSECLWCTLQLTECLKWTSELSCYSCRPAFQVFDLKVVRESIFQYFVYVSAFMFGILVTHSTTILDAISHKHPRLHSENLAIQYSKISMK